MLHLSTGGVPQPQAWPALLFVGLQLLTSEAWAPLVAPSRTIAWGRGPAFRGTVSRPHAVWPREDPRHPVAPKMVSAGNRQAGLVFPRHDEVGPAAQFDSAAVGMPRVHRYYHDEGDRWVMWYHGRDTEFAKEDNVLNVGTGRIGRATSSDGIHWERTPGQMGLGSVLDLNEEQWWGFDTTHIGLGCVNLGASERIPTEGGIYFMYYFGGGFEETDVQKEFGLTMPSGTDATTLKGVRLRIGLAVSQDGLNWSRVEGDGATGACLDTGAEGEWDEPFVGWPTVMNHRGEEFRLFYHTIDPHTQKYTVGLASSQDGLKWDKAGPVFRGGPEGAFDERGCARRDVILHNGLYYMLYEGVSKEGVHSIGLATSKDGLQWERSSDGPVFQRSEPGSGAWDAGGVTSPNLVDMENGRWYMYYVGVPEKDKGERAGSSIGVAVATNNDFTKWERLTVP